MSKEALKLALEALEVANSCVDGYYIPKGKTHLPEIELAITAIKEALANEALDKMAENARELGLDYEPPQEPVAWNAGIPSLYPKMKEGETISVEYVELTSPQRTWVGLTDKEIEEIWKIAMFTDYGIGAELSNQPFVHYAKAIEAKLKQKNT
jgi:hypothetical protein